MDSPTLTNAFTALEQYKEGSSRGDLIAIDEAVAASLADPAKKDPLEQRMAGLLKDKLSPVAKEYICRKLALFGSSRSVPALAAMLDDHDLSEAARTTLQAMPCAESRAALRESLATLHGPRKLGVINSLGACRDIECVPKLTGLLDSSDDGIGAAAAAALGEIGSLEAAKALESAHSKAAEQLRANLADARLVCAEHLLASGRKSEASAIYSSLNDAKQPAQVQVAAKRGLLRVALP